MRARVTRNRIYLALVLALLLPTVAWALPLTGGETRTLVQPTVPPPPTPTPAPTATPAPPQVPSALTPVPEAEPSAFNLRNSVVGKGQNNIAMPAQGGYGQVDGVLTFRGGPWRQNAAYGYASAPEGRLEIVWEKNIGRIDNWSGVGWNGQCALVRWPQETRNIMNLYDAKKAQEELVEVIYGTLDGHIYFLDLQDGTATRDPIDVGFPLKGSVSVDPRGVPLLYSGQGISRNGSKSGKIGMHIFSLLTGEELYFINGRDDNAYRNHGAFDSVPLVDAQSDTLLSPGENGLLYTLKLNTAYDPAAGTLSIAPERSAYRYRNGKGLGIENSLVVWGHYGYFTDNGALLQCVDLNTLTPIWAAQVTDDSDASCALDERPDGSVRLFTGCEVDRQGDGGSAYLRCFDALTGKLLWEYDEVCAYDKDVNGGLLGSPLVGKGPVDELVYFHVAKVYEGGGVLVALNKDTGEVAWRKKMPRYGWSSPVAVYGAEGEAHIVLGDSGGNLRLLDARTGEEKDRIELNGNIEGSPAVFGDMLVIGTRGCKIYGIRIR